MSRKGSRKVIITIIQQKTCHNCHGIERYAMTTKQKKSTSLLSNSRKVRHYYHTPESYIMTRTEKKGTSLLSYSRKVGHCYHTAERYVIAIIQQKGTSLLSYSREVTHDQEAEDINMRAEARISTVMALFGWNSALRFQVWVQSQCMEPFERAQRVLQGLASQRGILNNALSTSSLITLATHLIRCLQSVPMLL